MERVRTSRRRTRPPAVRIIWALAQGKERDLQSASSDVLFSVHHSPSSPSSSVVPIVSFPILSRHFVHMPLILLTCPLFASLFMHRESICVFLFSCVLVLDQSHGVSVRIHFSLATGTSSIDISVYPQPWLFFF